MKTTAGPVPPVRVQVQVGAGSEELEALIVTVLLAPAVTVWFWIGLIVGVGAACTVMNVLAVFVPQTFLTVKFTLYTPAANPVALKVGVVVVALVKAPFRLEPVAVPNKPVPAVQETEIGALAPTLVPPES